jgi:HK97 gp10 family phage protein
MPKKQQWFASDERKMIRRLEHIRAGHGRVGRQLSRQNAEAAAVSARARVHEISGYTKGTIKVVIVNQYTANVVAEGPGAVAEEYGTRHRPAHPFLGPAVAEVEPKALQEYKQAMLDLYGEGRS